MDTNDIKYTLEAALIASGESLSLSQMVALFDDEHQSTTVDTVEIQTALEALQQDYAPRGIELKKVASGYRLQLKASMVQTVLNLWQEKPQKYSRALLETLSLIAYRQPITRGDIEDVRGVSVSSQIIKTLLERDWIKIVGHRDVPGKPAMYATTNAFLDYFNLENLSQLPTLSEIREVDEQNRHLQFAQENSNENKSAPTYTDKATSAIREQQVLSETENDLTTAASLLAQVEANVFKPQASIDMDSSTEQMSAEKTETSTALPESPNPTTDEDKL